MNKETAFSHHESFHPRPEEREGSENSGLQIDHGNEAVLLDIGLIGDGEKAQHTSLKLAKDGHTVLIPQPTEDPEDPLNWSPFKKHMVLFIVALGSFVADFGSGAGIPCIFPQGAEWGMDPLIVNYAGNLNVIMLGIGGLLWIPASNFWGRAPVAFWTMIAGSVFTLVCALAPNFTVFYGFRALMGVTATACQTVGLAFIKDMFFFHEHARKIGLWVCMFFLSPYMGPMFGNFIIDGTGSWRAVFWLVFAVAGANVVLMILFLDETWYRRDIPINQQPARGSRLMRLIGVWQLRNHKGYFLPVGKSFGRQLAVLIKPIIIPVMISYMLSFMWAVGINITSSILFATPTSVGGYGFGEKAVGFLYFTPLVAVTLGEIFGHFFNDFIALRYIRKHNGIFVPEARLWSTYIGSFLMLPGLVIVGLALRHHLHYGAIVAGWGCYVFGVMLYSVAITAYVLDSYPTGSGEVGGFMNFARVTGGFTVGYFQSPWGEAMGYDVSFGIQAATVAIASMILMVLHKFGGRMRERAGPLKL